MPPLFSSMTREKFIFDTVELYQRWKRMFPGLEHTALLDVATGKVYILWRYDDGSGVSKLTHVPPEDA